MTECLFKVHIFLANMVSNDAVKTRAGKWYKGGWVEEYSCQKREKVLFTHGKKTTVRAVYQQKICDSTHNTVVFYVMYN